MSTTREQFEADARALAPPGSPKRLIVRRRGCGCYLGTVWDGSAGYVLIGEKRNLVITDADGNAEAHSGPFICLLEQPDRPEAVGCRHSSDGSPLPLGDILAAARRATRPRAYKVD